MTVTKRRIKGPLPPLLYELTEQAKKDPAGFLERLSTASTETQHEFIREVLKQKRIHEDKTPLDLAMRLDPMMVATPALRILANEMVGVRDAIALMYERRAMHAMLVRSGVDDKYARDKITSETQDRGTTRLIMSMPPQEGKSTLVTRYGALWLYRQFPMMRETLVSYDGSNAETFSYAIRADIELFNGEDDNIDLGLRLAPNQKAVSRFRLASGGSMYAIGIGGGLTGRPSDNLAIDDPVKDQKQADSELLSDSAWEWWSTTARPRLAPWAPVTLTMTRWHERDLGGRFQQKQLEDEAAGLTHFDKWRVVVIPAQADHDPSKGETDVLGREPGEFMISARGRGIPEWEATKASTPARYWSALYQGRPTPGTGDILLKEWWQRYDFPIALPNPDGTYRCVGYDVTQSWDFTFDDTKGSDYVVGQVWAKKGSDSYLIYQLRARLSFIQTLVAMRRVTQLFPQSRRKFVEKKANGAAVISSLKHEISGIIAVNPDRSKTDRATAASVYARAGNFWLPTSHIASMDSTIAFDPDVFIEEATAFPNGSHDDQVDAWSQYANETYLRFSPGRLISPTKTPRASSIPKQEGTTLSPMQRRLQQRKETPE